MQYQYQQQEQPQSNTLPLPSNLPGSEEPLSSTIQTNLLKPSEDSQTSTSTDSSAASSRNPSLSHWHEAKEGSIDYGEDTKFPQLLHAKLSSKSKSKPSPQNIKESELMIDTPVTEEGEEEEEGENQFLKKLDVMVDGEEFNIKKKHLNKFKGRENMFKKDLHRCRSLDTSFLPLDSVEEDKNEEDNSTFKRRLNLRLHGLKIEDLNEFNQCHSDRTLMEKKDKRNMSMTMQVSDEVIVEEQENNNVLPHLQSIFANNHSNSGSRKGSFITSPRTKLRVDEIDLWDRHEAKEDDSDEMVIDPIAEEAEEKNGNIEENKEFQVAKAKMNEEREFLKKVIKGDEIDESNNGLVGKIGTERDYKFLENCVTEEIIEEDNNENATN